MSFVADPIDSERKTCIILVNIRKPITKAEVY